MQELFAFHVSSSVQVRLHRWFTGNSFSNSTSHISVINNLLLSLYKNKNHKTFNISYRQYLWPLISFSSFCGTTRVPETNLVKSIDPSWVISLCNWSGLLLDTVIPANNVVCSIHKMSFLTELKLSFWKW